MNSATTKAEKTVVLEAVTQDGIRVHVWSDGLVTDKAGNSPVTSLGRSCRAKLPVALGRVVGLADARTAISNREWPRLYLWIMTCRDMGRVYA
jgi:hypothetical protein